MRSASNASSTVAQGQDLASLLLGLPTGGSYDLNSFGSFYSYYLAGFVQDDWRLKSNLTLNLGLRYDWNGPYHEKFGRTVNGFDTTTPNPIAAAAMSAYNLSPIPQIPAGSFDVPGGLNFASPGNNAVYQNTSHLFSPRIGFSWSPTRLGGKTVLRGGFGMFVAPVTIANLAVSGKYSTTPILNQEGFSATTSMVVTNDNYLTPAATLGNPFPGGFEEPAGSSQGLSTFLGQTVSYLNPSVENPYSIRWNFGVQHTITPNLLFEAVYMGNHSVHLPVSITQLNGIPRQFLSTLPVRDNAVNTALTATVNNPFAGLIPGQTSNGKTTSVAQLLARFPEFPAGDASGGWSGSTGVLADNLNSGSSYFESLNLHLQKRLTHGLSVTGNYIYSRLIESDSWLNDSDRQLEKRVSPFDFPHRFVLGFSYELPTGRGHALGLQSRWANLLVGGWHVNGIYTYQRGAPITWVNGSTTTPGDYVYFGGPGALSVDNRQTNSAAFNTSLFATNSSQAFAYHIRTFSTTFPNIRADGVNELDTSVLKRFDVTEKKYFELRFEFFNVVNHPTFVAPDTRATNAAFATITAQADRPRTIQLGARFVF